MNKLDNAKRVQVVRCLVEGNSIRATVRMTGVAKNTVAKLLVDLGTACARYQDENLRNLSCKRLQCDEIWSFVGAKQKNVSEAQMAEGWGDVWTWTAIDADTKLIPCWMVGQRGLPAAREFIHDLMSRMNQKERIQLTTDGHGPYVAAVRETVGERIDFAQLIKVYGTAGDTQTRYTPGECLGIEKKVVSGKPDPKHISTSFVERQNLTMRMSMRRFTRLTNAFSKKIENHMAAIALHFMYYNFARVHNTLRVTPAMEAGISHHVWTVEEIVQLLDKKSLVDGLLLVDSN